MSKTTLLEVPEPGPEQHNGHTHGQGPGPGPGSQIDLLLAAEADDSGNAQTMLALYKDRLLYSPALGWLEWEGTYWKQVTEAIVTRLADDTLIRRRHAAVDAKNETLVKATRSSRDHITSCVYLFRAYVTVEDVNEFDSDPDLLNCLNGVVHLRTGSLTPHYPCQRFTYCVPVEYDPQADMALWVEFIHQALEREAIVHYFQRCIGYSFTGHTREEKLFYAFGPSRAGKGTCTETLLALLPHPIGTEIDFNSFTARRDADSQNFDLAALKPSRLVIASESNRYQSLNPAKIKSLTGGNLIRAAFKHRDMFTFRPQFKVWLVSNHEVNGDPDDDALWGRVQVFIFPRSYLGQEDTTLKERLKAPTALQGVLRWIVEGAMLWYQEGKLSPPQEIITATASHRDMGDYVKQWLNDEKPFESESWVSTTNLLKSYKSWCEENSVKPIEAKAFVSTLVKRFGCIQKRPAGNGPRGLLGKLVPPVPPVPPETGYFHARRFVREKPPNQVALVAHGTNESGQVALKTGSLEPEIDSEMTNGEEPLLSKRPGTDQAEPEQGSRELEIDLHATYELGTPQWLAQHKARVARNIERYDEANSLPGER